MRVLLPLVAFLAVAPAHAQPTFEKPDCSAFAGAPKPEVRCYREIRHAWQEKNFAALQKTGLMFVYMERPDIESAPEAREVMPGVDALSAEALHHGSVEHPEQRTPVHRDLGPAVPCRFAARLAPDALPVLRVERHIGGRDADPRRVVDRAKLGQLADGVRQDVDPDAQLLDPRRRLVDLDVGDPCRMQ